MVDLRALYNQRGDLQTDLQALVAIDEGTEGELTEEQVTQHASLITQIEQLDAKIKRLEQAAAIQPATYRETEPSPAAPAAGTGRVEVGVDRATERPWDSHPGAGDGLGHFLQAVAFERMPSGIVPQAGFRDPRLYATISGGSTSVPSDGGHVVGLQMNTALLDQAMDEAILAPRCFPIPVGENFDGVELPGVDETSRADGSRWGGVRVYRAAEADSVTKAKPVINNREIRLEDLKGLAYMTLRQIRDAPAMQALYTKSFASEFSFKVDDEIIRGSGSGEILGLAPSGAAGAATVSQAKQTGQAADTVVAENFSKMYARMPVRNRRNAVWLVNAELGPMLDKLQIAAGTGATTPSWIRYGEDGVMRIKGKPVIELEQCSAPGDVGDVFFVDLGAFLLVTKGGIEAASSMHVRFIFDEMTFKWTQRISGQPAWRTTKTVFKGANAISPYVTLAARA